MSPASTSCASAPDDFCVLEDNCRTPSGVSYMLENREAMLRLFPELFGEHRIAPISHYPEELLETLRSVAPRNCRGEPTVALLTPGAYNSAYYEHSFLADEMGVELVEGADLIVDDGVVYMRTTEGLQRVDVIYRRIDDEFLDPLAFRPIDARRAGALRGLPRRQRRARQRASAPASPTTRAIYPLRAGDDPLLPRRGAAARRTCRPGAAPSRGALAYVLERLPELVVKETRGSGGYGMLVGPAATNAERDEFAAKLTRDARATTSRSRRSRSPPVRPSSRAASRRATSTCGRSCCTGREIRIVPGGLTRVALREGSLVVNSSQGGGTKDTWVLEA